MIRVGYQDLCERETADSRPKGGRTRLSAVVWTFPYRFGGADLLSHPGARGGLDARLGASTIHGTNHRDRSARHGQIGHVSPSTVLGIGRGRGSLPGKDRAVLSGRSADRKGGAAEARPNTYRIRYAVVLDR